MPYIPRPSGPIICKLDDYDLKQLEEELNDPQASIIIRSKDDTFRQRLENQVKCQLIKITNTSETHVCFLTIHSCSITIQCGKSIIVPSTEFSKSEWKALQDKLEFHMSIEDVSQLYNKLTELPEKLEELNKFEIIVGD